MLAKFYLSKNTKESLKGCTESTGTFQIALGGDECLFGKNESTCSFSPQPNESNWLELKLNGIPTLFQILM